MSRASSISVRSTTSTATGPSLTMCWVASMALRKVAKWQMPSALFLGMRGELQFEAARERERAFRAAQQRGEVDGPRARHQRVDQVAADAPRHLRERVRDVLRLAPAEGEQVAEQRDGLLVGSAVSPTAEELPSPCGEGSGVGGLLLDVGCGSPPPLTPPRVVSKAAFGVMGRGIPLA